MALLRLIALPLLLVFAARAATIPDRFIVELRGEPAAPYVSRRAHRAKFSDSLFRGRLEEIGREHRGVRAALEQAGAVVTGGTMVATNTLFVQLRQEKEELLNSIPGVSRVHPERLFNLQLDHALPLTRIPDAWRQIGGMDQAGTGIKIAIIDSGLDSSHPGLNDPSLPLLPGYPLVNQNSDRRFTSNKIIVARSYTDKPASNHDADDLSGHGTGVAMVAAGMPTAGQFGLITGVAPKAFLGNYKVFPDGRTGAPESLILQAIGDAVTDGMDVINLSLGSNPAPRPRDDILVAAVENAVAAGVIVIIAAGNSGPNPNTIASPATAPNAISAGSVRNDRVFAAAIQIAGSDSFIAIPGNGPNSPSPITGPLIDVATFDPAGLACGPLPPGSLNSAIVLIMRGTCTFEVKINTAQQAGASAALIFTDAARPDAINMATGAGVLPAAMVDYASGAALRQQLASGPITSTLDFALLPRFISPNRLDDSSSVGPSSDGGIKPDLVAVGANISTAQPLSKGGFIVESGTSFSAPAIAGAAALLKAARPGLTVQQYRSLLINNSTALVFDSGIAAATQKAGAGKLNMLSALNATVAAFPASVSFAAKGSTVDQTRTITLTNLGAGTNTFSLFVSMRTGSTAPRLSRDSLQLDAGQSKDVSLRFSADGLAPGPYEGTIQILGAQDGTRIEIPYWYAAGGGTAQYLSVLAAPSSGSPGSRQTIEFRITGKEGILIVAEPQAVVTAGRGTVQSIQSVDSKYPGVHALVVQLGPVIEPNSFQISAAGLTVDVTIQAR